MFIRTTATYKIFDLKKRIRGVAGGTSASKTISILMWCIQYAMTHEGVLISIVSETFPHLKRGAMRDFLSILEAHQAYKEKEWNRTDCIYTFGNNSKIEFFSADQPGKVRGPRRDVLFINEANNISEETFDQLEVRTKSIIWLDWNPVSEFWWYTNVAPQREVDFLILTYKDNEALDPQIVASIEARQYNKNWWKVYGLGELGEAEGRVYTGWNTEIDEIPFEARLERYGMDFGYSNDPTAIVAIYYYNGGYILDEVCYQKGLSNKDIADLINTQPKALVVADSAEPKSIDEIKNYGVNITAANKGAGSILQGIQYVQDQRISVTKRSLNILKEYRNYLWLTDKDGKIINTPQDFLNHCFVGNTEIRTVDGYKQIKDIKKGDWVVTSKGVRSVLRRWDNGIKQVNKYSLQFDTFSVILEATPDHLIKTTKGWKKISLLQSGMGIYHNNYLGINSSTSTQMKDTFQGGQNECIQKYGSFITVRSLKGFTSIIKTKILGIIDYLIWSYSKLTNTSQSMYKRGLKITLNGLEPSNLKVFRWLSFGTLAPMELNGIKGTELKLTQEENSLNITVNNAGNIITQSTRVYPNIAIQTAKLKRLDVEEGKRERVYDLEVQGCHEYFANTILVHNCLDALRYGMESFKPQEDKYIDNYVRTFKEEQRKWQI